MTTTCPIDGAELAPGAAICGGCVNGLRVDLGAVPSRLDDLDLTLSRQHSRTSEGVSDPECPPVDYDVAASDARRELVRVLTVYGRRWLAAVAPIAPERKRAVELLYGSTKGRAALIAGYRALGAAGWAPLLAAELRDALKAAQAAIDRPPAVEFAGWCPAVEHTTHVPLYVVGDSAWATCARCGNAVVAEDNRARTMAMAAATIERATPADLARAFSLKSATIRSWTRREWLTPPDAAGGLLVAEVRTLSLGLRPKRIVWELRSTEGRRIERFKLPHWRDEVPSWRFGRPDGLLTGTFCAFRDGVHVLTYEIDDDGQGGTVTDVQRAAAAVPSQVQPTPPEGVPCQS